jgi:hypothetical protein
VQLAGGQHEQKPFAHGLRVPALGAVKLAGGKSPKLLRHGLTFPEAGAKFKGLTSRAVSPLFGVGPLRRGGQGAALC